MLVWKTLIIFFYLCGISLFIWHFKRRWKTNRCLIKINSTHQICYQRNSTNEKKNVCEEKFTFSKKSHNKFAIKPKCCFCFEVTAPNNNHLLHYLNKNSEMCTRTKCQQIKSTENTTSTFGFSKRFLWHTKWLFTFHNMQNGPS